MKKRILLFISYYLFWLLLSMAGKPLFLLLYHHLSEDVTMWSALDVLYHGMPLDLSVAAYITVGWGIIVTLSTVLSYPRLLERVASVYTAIVLAIYWLIVVGDLGLYGDWRFRIDKTIFIYLDSPSNVWACAEWYVWLAGFVAWVVAAVASWGIYRRLFSSALRGLERVHWMNIVPMALLTALLFLPIRGSLSVATLNTGRVYFSENQLLNHAAIHPVFNMMESLGERTFDTPRYTYMCSDEAHALVDSVFRCAHPQVAESLLTTSRPNIFLIILESFSANALEAMPNVCRLAAEGLSFTNCYSGSFRTDRGVVCVLSGFPGQPTSSLMKVPAKSEHLPFLSQDLRREGYHLRFYYGGDENFTSMRSYLMSAGYTDRVSVDDFSAAESRSKWGAHDHTLFRRVEQTYREVEEPYLQTILTLSSHEPFDVPSHRRYDDLYLNSVAYTDSCVGAFVDSLRARDEWTRTLVVLVADHGFHYPEGVNFQSPRRYRIPMIIAGGALREAREIPTVCSQIDLAPTLLSMLNIDSHYYFGKDIMALSESEGYAYFSFVDGFGWVDAEGATVVDARADRTIETSHTNTGFYERLLRAYTQCVYETIDQL